MAALPFEYPNGATRGLRKRFKDRTLRGNEDILYYDNHDSGEKANLIFFTTNLREWQNAMETQYVELQESQTDSQILLSSEKYGTISLYRIGKVVVMGRTLMRRFEYDFPEMRQRTQRTNPLPEMAALNINNEDSSPDQPEGALPTQTNHT